MYQLCTDKYDTSQVLELRAKIAELERQIKEQEATIQQLQEALGRIKSDVPKQRQVTLRRIM